MANRNESPCIIIIIITSNKINETILLKLRINSNTLIFANNKLTSKLKPITNHFISKSNYDLNKSKELL